MFILGVGVVALNPRERLARSGNIFGGRSWELGEGTGRIGEDRVEFTNANIFHVKRPCI